MVKLWSECGGLGVLQERVVQESHGLLNAGVGEPGGCFGLAAEVIRLWKWSGAEWNQFWRPRQRHAATQRKWNAATDCNVTLLPSLQNIIHAGGVRWGGCGSVRTMCDSS
jgi:hypothetical protein